MGLIINFTNKVSANNAFKLQNSLEDTSLFYTSDKSRFDTLHQDTRNICIGYQKDGQLIAYANAVIKEYCNKDYLKKIRDIQDTYYFRTIFVHSDYRNNGLMKKLIKKVEDTVIKKGGNNIVLTVHPNNIPSKKGFMSRGYIKIDHLEGDYIRDILWRRLV